MCVFKISDVKKGLQDNFVTLGSGKRWHDLSKPSWAGVEGYPFSSHSYTGIPYTPLSPHQKNDKKGLCLVASFIALTFIYIIQYIVHNNIQ